MMVTRVAVIGIIVENPDSVDQLNAILHRYSGYILGRMGIPYREKGVFVICVVLDAPPSAVNALTGKIGQLEGVAAKTLVGKF